MKTFGTLDAKDYNVEEMYTSAPMSWELVSSSNGVQVTSPADLVGAVMVQRASNDYTNYYYTNNPKLNTDSGTYEYILYRSIKHVFYNGRYFYSGSVLQTSSLAGLPNDFYVISVGQDFYGNRIKPGTFEISTEIANKTIVDDEVGNLYISQSGVGTYVGNVFYDSGIAVVKMDTGSVVTAMSSGGLKLVQDSELYVDYSSDVKYHRHEVNIKIDRSEFNFSPFNPSIFSTYTATTGSVTQSWNDLNIRSSASSPDTWNMYNLMGAGVVNPYITTVGLYNEQYELLAVAKLVQPIQRSFDINQIFIIRFDT
jgi:hypothetical protein